MVLRLSSAKKFMCFFTWWICTNVQIREWNGSAFSNGFGQMFQSKVSKNGGKK